jgi:hypothetical protein
MSNSFLNCSPVFDTLPSGLQQGIRSIAQHPSVRSIDDLKRLEDRQQVDVAISLQLELPIQWMAEGYSPNGVRAVEPVILEIPLSYPIHAPAVRLRDDFDCSLAHVQPRLSDPSIYPCIYEGNIDELLHSRGIWAILDQAIDWLHKAAMGQLIDPKQGWEPVRRDSYRHILVIDHDFIRRLVLPSRENYVFLRFTYHEVRSSNAIDDSSLPFIYGQVESKKLQVHQHSVGDCFARSPWSSLQFSLAIVVTPGGATSRRPHVADQYHPEQVSDYESLRQQAQEYGCWNSLDTALKHLRKTMGGFAIIPGESGQIAIAVILCARRPFHLIGEQSDIEIVPYLLRINIASPQLLPQGDRTPVMPAAPHQAISTQLLRRFSGTSFPEPRPITLLGCGSLGSKIALHLARSGAAPRVVVDNRLLTAHNAARHGLIPSDSIYDRSWLAYKADTLALAIKALKQDTKPFNVDVTLLTAQPQLLPQLFPQHTWSVVNATASLTVRETLSAIKPDVLPYRIIETSLYADGKVGMMTVEGAGRNPNSLDLLVQAYETMRLDNTLQKAVLTSEEPSRAYGLGDGCSSLTMAASDSEISLVAAAMTVAIARLRSESIQGEDGQVILWQVTNDGIGVQTTSLRVPPVHVLSIDQNADWTVRLSEQAHQKILQDCADHPRVETGGILMGRISYVQQAFLVSDILTMPSGWERSSSQFILNPGGVSTLIQDYQTTAGGSLYCLGTWHSHLTESSSSPQDIQTCEMLKRSRDVPFVLLVKTPGGYHAIATN